MSKNKKNDIKNDIKKILKLVSEIHSKILEPSTTSKVATGLKTVANNVPIILKKIQQQGGKTKIKKSKDKKKQTRKKVN